MTENMLKALNLSITIANHYSNVIQKYYDEDYIESDDDLEGIKKLVQKEMVAYNKLSREETNALYYYLDTNLLDILTSLAKHRIKCKISEHNNRMNNGKNAGMYYIKTAIEYKLTTCAIKIIKKRVEDLEENISIEEIEGAYQRLVENCRTLKYNYLISNIYMEAAALDVNYNVDEIKDITMEDIKKIDNNDSTGSINAILYMTFFNEMRNLIRVNTQMPIHNTCGALYYISRIEVLLELCDKTTLEKISKKFQNDYTKKDERTNQVDILIRKRKENLK